MELGAYGDGCYTQTRNASSNCGGEARWWCLEVVELDSELLHGFLLHVMAFGTCCCVLAGSSLAYQDTQVVCYLNWVLPHDVFRLWYSRDKAKLCHHVMERHCFLWFW